MSDSPQESTTNKSSTTTTLLGSGQKDVTSVYVPVMKTADELPKALKK